MKHLFVLLFALFGMILHQPLHAQKIFRTTANLNIRVQPTTRSGVITVVPVGSKLQIVSYVNSEWAAVRYNGYLTYVSRKYIRPYRNTNSVKHYNQSSRRYYTNSEGYRVQSPTYYNSVPAGATAICRDGTYSFSRSRRGTCSHHGGVAVWLK